MVGSVEDRVHNQDSAYRNAAKITFCFDFWVGQRGSILKDLTFGDYFQNGLGACLFWGERAATKVLQQAA